MSMDITAEESRANSAPARHWLWQVVPPLLLFGVFFTTRSGSALVYLAGLLLLPVLFSLISIIAKLVRFRQRRRYLLRPLLTISVFMVILAIAEWTYQDAREQTITVAKSIHQQCQLNATCPRQPADWQLEDSMARKDDLGRWLHYSALYYVDGARFSMRLYRGPDIGDVISGGAGLPFETMPYVDG